MKKRVYVMAVLIAISMLFGSLPVSAREKAKLDAVSKEKTLAVTLLMPDRRSSRNPGLRSYEVRTGRGKNGRSKIARAGVQRR